MVINSKMSNWTKFVGVCKKCIKEIGEDYKEKFDFPNGHNITIFGFYAFQKSENGFIIWVRSSTHADYPKFVCHEHEWYEVKLLGKELIELSKFPKVTYGKTPVRMTKKFEFIKTSEDQVLKETGLTNVELSPDGSATIRI